jgi:uncharacterized protein (TIGR03792 family)
MNHTPPLSTITAALVLLDTTPAPVHGQRPSAAGDPDHPVESPESAKREPAGVGAIELLRLRVPAPHREIWLVAERAIWEPWLLRQAGFMGRELFWDPLLEHGVLVIRWASRHLLHGISAAEVARVHQSFQQHARELLQCAGHRLENQLSASSSGAADCFPLLHASEVEPEPPRSSAA